LADEAESDPDRPQNSEVLWICSRDGSAVVDFVRANLEGSEPPEGEGPVASVEEIFEESIRHFYECDSDSSSRDSPEPGGRAE
jgi:hypothetical protein